MKQIDHSPQQSWWHSGSLWMKTVDLVCFHTTHVMDCQTFRRIIYTLWYIYIVYIRIYIYIYIIVMYTMSQHSQTKTWNDPAKDRCISHWNSPRMGIPLRGPPPAKRHDTMTRHRTWKKSSGVLVVEWWFNGIYIVGFTGNLMGFTLW